MRQVCAVIVLYNPEVSVLDNISSYIDSVDKFYIVDNSEEKNILLIDTLKEYSNTYYLDNNGNQGIAHALNVGCNKAIDDGYDWILTMDQDSFVFEGMIETLLEYRADNVAIVSPFHADKYFPFHKTDMPIQEILSVATSGNLLNLKIFEKIGIFEEKLFIDYVDTEYCLRANIAGYKVLLVSNAILKHKLGEISQHIFLGKKFYTSNHNYIRRYYNARNRFYVYDKYSVYDDYIREDKKTFLKEIVKIILFEKDKIKKVYYILLGLWDSRHQKFGKLNAS